MTLPGAASALTEPMLEDHVRPPDYTVPAVDKALRILRLLSLSTDGLALGELSSQLELPKSTTHSILITLAHHHFAERDGDGRWTLGLSTFEVGSAYAERMDVVTAFRSVAARLAAECGQTVQLGMLDGRDVVYVAKVDGTEPVRLVFREGTRLPAHTTALGKAILASLPSHQFESLYSGRVIAAQTPYSIVSLQALRTELERVRGQGFAYDNEETALGLHCVAAVVPARDSPAAASISIAIPSHRMSETRFNELKVRVMAAAAAIAARLGYRADGANGANAAVSVVSSANVAREDVP